MKKVVIKKSVDKGKKLTAIFTREDGSTKKISFGSAGMDDFTKKKDEAQKKRYLARHRARENWNNPESAGALSRWILWNKTSRQASIADFKRRFNYR
tara:strand:- start:32 stop:322 length:291 start_codon:yes stop_codon:yes gene_type:complete